MTREETDKDALRDLNDALEQRVREQTAQIRESELRFRLMANQAPVLIWISGPDRACTWFNDPWLNFTGRTMQQELGNGWTEGVHPEDSAGCLETYAAAFDARRPFTMEYRLRRHDGEWRWLVDTGVPLRHEDGAFAGYIGSCIDITSRKEIELELEQSRKDLRAMAAERMLAEERERQRLAQDLHDGLGQAVFLARHKLDQSSVSEVGAILNDITRMVNDFVFEISPPVLHQLGFEAAIKWLVRDVKQRYGLSVRLVSPRSPIPPVDEILAMVLFRSTRELLTNVFKHAGADSATLRIRKSDSRIEIEVEDRGKGFDPLKQSRLVSSTMRFGLLSIREQIAYVGGAVNIHSAPMKGTRVTISAPVAFSGNGKKKRSR
jgi:PAS domain S-box-containing protein